MQTINELVDGGCCVLIGGFGQVCIACSGGGVGMAEQALDMAQAQAAFQQVGGKAVPKRMNGYLFFIPHSASKTFTAFCVPPRSMWVVAVRMRFGEPTALYTRLTKTTEQDAALAINQLVDSLHVDLRRL
jgi:hypothetical protein